MSLPDIINGTYESCGAIFILTSILKLYKDKKVRGIHWVHTAFFTSWGYWNLYYYPHLNQWISFLGGIGIVIANSIWLFQIIYYLRKEKLNRNIKV